MENNEFEKHCEVLDRIVFASSNNYENYYQDQNIRNKLIEIVKKINNVHIIDFVIGYSALIALIYNSNCKVFCFYNDNPISEICFTYLSENFKNRITAIKGDTRSTRCSSADFTIIENNSDPLYSNIHFFITADLAKNSYIFFPTNNNILENFWNGYIENNKVEELYNFKICKIGKIKTVQNIVICSLAIGEQYKKIVHHGIITKKMYCLQHSYNFRDDVDTYDKTRHPAWSKINLLLKCLNDNYDWVIWMDADTLIMNPNILLEDMLKYTENKSIMIARDNYNFNTGVLFVKNTEWSKNFLKLVYDQIQYLNDPNWEQTAIIYLYDNNILNSKDNIQPVYQQNLFNSYWFMYKKGDFILHFAGCWKDGKNNGLDKMMELCCPYRKRNESEQEYQNRINTKL